MREELNIYIYYLAPRYCLYCVCNLFWSSVRSGYYWYHSIILQTIDYPGDRAN